MSKKQYWANFDWDSIDFKEQLDILEKSNTFNFTKRGLTATLTEEFKSFCEFYDIECGHHYMWLVEQNRDELRYRNLPIFLLENSDGSESTITLHNMDVVLNGNDDDGYPETRYNFGVLESDYWDNWEINGYKIVEIIDKNIKIDDLPKEILEAFSLDSACYDYNLAYANPNVPNDHINDLISDLLQKDIGDKITYKPINKELSKEYILYLSELIADTISNSENYHNKTDNVFIKDNQKSMYENVSETLLETFDDMLKNKNTTKPNKQR